MAARATIKLEGEIHLLFAFDPTLTNIFLQRLLDQQKQISLFIFRDRAQLINTAQKKSSSSLFHFLDDVKRENLYFFVGDSRYPNLGMNFNTWQKFLPKFDYIWMLPPQISFGQPFYLHQHFWQMYQKLQFLEKKPQVFALRIREALKPEEDHWLRSWPQTTLSIAWPHSLVDYMYSVKAPKQNKKFKTLTVQNSENIVTSLLNYLEINEFTKIADESLNFRKLKYKKKHSYFEPYHRFIHP